MDSNSPFSLNTFLNGLELKAKAREIQLAGKPVPTHIKLPELQDIVKMRPAPTPDGRGEEGAHQDKIMKSFIFVIKHLVGAILGKKCGTSTSVMTGFLQNLHHPMKPTYMSSYPIHTTYG